MCDAEQPKFDLNLDIVDLNNIPLVSGTCHVKWQLSSSITAEHRGHTPKAMVREHKAVWNYRRTIPVRITVDKTGLLHNSEIHFEIVQEYTPDTRAERMLLGVLKLNLSEYVSEETEDEGVVRRYLMQDSRINSTLKVKTYKIGIALRQIEGDANFEAPPLKSAPVFGGIAGIITAETGVPQEDGEMSNMSKMSRGSKVQDMYRRNLAASWAAQAGELPAHECIDDIFAGGDGWAKPQPHEEKKEPPRKLGKPAKNITSYSFAAKAASRLSGREHGDDMVDDELVQRQQRLQRDELNEFLEREDLRSWTIRGHSDTHH